MHLSRIQRTLIIGTRGSALALWQANHIKNKLLHIGLTAELKVIKTQGDKITNLPLSKLEGKGFFTKEIEEELLKNGIDIAVHSYKDLPTKSTPGLCIAALSEREDPSELLIINKEQVDFSQALSLKPMCIVGTSSSRRKAQLLALRPDLFVKDLRGNVPTRIEKLKNQGYSAIIIAKAGVKRLGIDLSAFFTEELSPVEFVTAPAQGVLAVQIRSNDGELYEKLQEIHAYAVEECVGIERQVLSLSGGGCHTPLACYCRKQGGVFQVWTSKAKDGSSFPDRLFMTSSSSNGLAERIIEKFAEGRSLPSRVFISRKLERESYLSRALNKHGIHIDNRALIHIRPCPVNLNAKELRKADWVFFSSKNGVEHFFKLGIALSKKIHFGVIGRGTHHALKKYGVEATFNGVEYGCDTQKIAQEFAKLVKNKTVLFPAAKDSLRTVQKALLPGTTAIELSVYETLLAAHVEPSFAEVLIFTSPSNVEAYFKKIALLPQQRVICAGKSTAKAYENKNMGVPCILPFSPDELGLAEAIFGL